MTMKIEQIHTSRVKSISTIGPDYFAIVQFECRAGTGQPFHYVAMSLRALDSLIKLTADIDGPYDLELMQRSEKMLSLVTDVIVIAPTKDREN